MIEFLARSGVVFELNIARRTQNSGRNKRRILSEQLIAIFYRRRPIPISDKEFGPCVKCRPVRRIALNCCLNVMPGLPQVASGQFLFGFVDEVRSNAGASAASLNDESVISAS